MYQAICLATQKKQLLYFYTYQKELLFLCQFSVKNRQKRIFLGLHAAAQQADSRCDPLAN